MQLTLQVHDHIVHFYHLHALDWVDVVSALSADPKATSALAQSISDWPLSSPGYFKDVQTRLKKFVESGQLGPFKNGYWGCKAYRLPPEANLMAVAHYLEALDFQKDIVKIHTIFGGKNPHPNWLVGGVPCPINVDGIGSVGAINMERLNFVKEIIDRSINSPTRSIFPTCWPSARSTRTGSMAGACRASRVLSYGDIPEHANDYRRPTCCCRRARSSTATSRRSCRSIYRDPNEIQEFVAHSWYKYPDETKGLHPWDGVTEPHYVLGPNAKGTRTNIESARRRRQIFLDQVAALEGPCHGSRPARPLGHRLRPGQVGVQGARRKLLKELGVPLTALFSTLGRTAARGLECQWAADKMLHFQNKLIANIKAGDSSTANVEKWDPKTWPAEVKGVGFTEAPRGALAHWIKIKDGKIDNYQAVVPTTWNGSPRDPQGNIGAFEASLMDTPMADPDAAAGDHPHAAFLRSLPCLLDPCDEPGRPGNGEGAGALSATGAGVMVRAHPHAGKTAQAAKHLGRVVMTNGESVDIANWKAEGGRPPHGLCLQAPVRIWHWVNALATCAGRHRLSDRLAACLAVGGEASAHFQMGYIRFTHFAAGQIMAVFFLLRIYWAFVGNSHAGRSSTFRSGAAISGTACCTKSAGTRSWSRPEAICRPQSAGPDHDVLRLHARRRCS